MDHWKHPHSSHHNNNLSCQRKLSRGEDFQSIRRSKKELRVCVEESFDEKVKIYTFSLTPVWPKGFSPAKHHKVHKLL
jgi:hypothetical protein